MAARGDSRAIVAFAGLLAVVALLGTALPGAGAPAPRDPNDVEGPLDLARARLDQSERRVLLTLRVHDSLPRLADLRRYPSRVGAAGERYLCLRLEGRRLGRHLYCPGGPVRHGLISVGVSSFGRQGAATRRGHFRARVRRRGRAAIELRMALSEFGHGRFRWAALSGWSGERCAAPAGGRDGRADDARHPCVDRLPDSRLASGRFRGLRRVGCTRASPLVNHSGSSRGRRIALTFDDGPSAYTARILRILDRAGAEATFFVAGSEVPGDGAVMRRALAHGHELGNHSLRHELSPSAASLSATSARVEAATGFRPCAYRPPYGAVGSGVVDAARGLGMSTVIWDVDTVDWSNPGPGAIYSRAVGGAHPGAIVLMHDGGGYRGQTVAALPGIVSTLRSRGYDLVTVTKILGERFVWAERG